MSDTELENKILILEERIVYLEKLNKELAEQNSDLRNENDRISELISFLPTDAKDQINLRGNMQSLRYKMVTVLFANIKGFTKLSNSANAHALIDELDDFFFHFDKITDKYNIQKVKSIGDTYMCAGGIPRKNRTNPIEVIMAALEMQQYLKIIQASEKINRKIWHLTFGIHTGPVTASISGKKKISYDIKGDTANIASRIESTSLPAMINISEMTYRFVKNFFACEYRSKIPIKYKGDTPVYTVKGFRPELSEKGEGKIPNEKFFTKFQKVQFEDLSEYVMNRLERELPKHLYYHNLKHTIDVTIGVEIIGSGEGVSESDMVLLKTAALFHDFGQIKGALNHEERSAKIAQRILPSYNYTKQQIATITDLIMATKLPPKPKTLLEKIMADADLDYLGRKDFIPVSDSLYRELKVQGLISDFNEWNKLQIKFLSAHQFFTNTAQKMRSVNKEKQIERIKSLIV